MAEENKSGQEPDGGKAGPQAGPEGAPGRVPDATHDSSKTAPPGGVKGAPTPGAADARVKELESRILAMQKEMADAVRERDATLTEIHNVRGTNKSANERIADLENQVRRERWWAQLGQQFGKDEARIRTAMLLIADRPDAFLEAATDSQPERVKIDALLDQHPHLKPASPGPAAVGGANPGLKPPGPSGSEADLERAIQGGNEYAIWAAFEARRKLLESEQRTVQPRMPQGPIAPRP